MRELNNTGPAAGIIQDTIAIRQDTILQNVPDTSAITANADSLLMLRDTSPDQVVQSLPGRTNLSQEPEPGNQAYQQDIPYFIPESYDLNNQNLSLINFGKQYFSIRETSELVFKDDSGSVTISLAQEFSPEQGQNITTKTDLNPDWLIAIIIGSLVVLAWLKLFFNKFINQVIVAMWNFQLGSKFLRDQGIFSRRVGFVLNINFLLIFGLFIYLLFAHFNINPLSLDPFPAYLVYTGLLSLIFLIKYILTYLTGRIFNKEEYFREYIYHFMIIYKNVGILFIPIVFCIAYIQENLRIYFIITALVVFALAYLFQFVKGFQLIIKKDVLIFYLILYLCTLEILPVLFYYKFFSGWI